MTDYDPTSARANRIEQAAHYLTPKRLKKLAKRIISLSRESARAEELTLFGGVYRNTGKILSASNEIDDYLVENELPEDITLQEVTDLLALFPEGTQLTSSSLSFNESDHLPAVYELLRNTYGEPVFDMNAYRYVGIQHPNPNPYGLDCEFFVVGLHKPESDEYHGIANNKVLGKASLEPVFLDVVDGLNLDSERFAAPGDLARVVEADRRIITHTLQQLKQEFDT